MPLEMAELEEGELAAFHRAVVLLWDQAMKLLLVALQELVGAEFSLAVTDVAFEGASDLVRHLMPSQRSGRLESFVALFTFVGTHLTTTNLIQIFILTRI
jgi:hypothetical protein